MGLTQTSWQKRAEFPGTEAVAQRSPEACNFIKKETLAQVFSCEFCEISKNTLCYRTPPVAASVGRINLSGRHSKLLLDNSKA